MCRRILLRPYLSSSKEEILGPEPAEYERAATARQALTSLPKGSLPKDCLHKRRDGIVVRASASQSVDLGFIPLVESYRKTLKNDIYSFPAWRSAFMRGCGEQAGKFACCGALNKTPNLYVEDR